MFCGCAAKRTKMKCFCVHKSAQARHYLYPLGAVFVQQSSLLIAEVTQALSFPSFVHARIFLHTMQVRRHACERTTRYIQRFR